jgi:hypothetical protein
MEIPTISSLVPILDKTLSLIGRVQWIAGTKHPICARIIISATCLIYVDLPLPL